MRKPIYKTPMGIRTDSSLDRLLEGLNGPQREAVAHTDGPLLILAGPGSGKTRVVTRRAAYLARTVAAPHQILAITFTNKAAKELGERMDALKVGRGITACTFHAFCAKLLRQHADVAGVPRNYTIFDRDDRRKLLKRAIEACDLSATNWPVPMVERVISDAKNKLQSAEAFLEADYDFRDRTCGRIYESYERLTARHGGLDFDDLLMKVALLLGTNSEFRDLLEDRYRYVLIDEYQDTNKAQYDIARCLTRTRNNLCATGDPDQSIYGWRGADLQNILTFEEDYAGAKVVRLEQNYRSTKRILQVADALIGGNVARKQKSLWTDNEEGAAVRVVECESGEDEAETVAAAIKDQLGRGERAGDIAVFYRINSLSRVLEEALLREGVAYKIARGVEFYNRREIKDVLAYLRVLVNPADEVALLRIINTPPRGIGGTTIERLVALARSAGVSVFEVLTKEGDVSEIGRSAGKVREFGMLLRSLADTVTLPAPEALKRVVSLSGLAAQHRSLAETDDAPAANVEELISAAATFHRDHPDTSITDWLEHTALVSDVDAIQGGGSHVTLMTLHAAKGLEYATVYTIGLEDGLLPFRRHDSADLDEEEERRLFFVGMTRARERLVISRARYRMLRGITERTTRSPFLDELPKDGVEWHELGETRKHSAAPCGRLPGDIDEWTLGTLVRHPIRGVGRIESLARGSKRTHVDVLFQSGHRQSWVLEFAELERVDFDEEG